MDKYKYGNIEDVKPGDIVEAKTSDNEITEGNLYIVKEGGKGDSGMHIIKDNGEPSYGLNLSNKYWKLVLTKPGSEAKVGDEVICIESSPRAASEKIGNLYTVEGVSPNLLITSNHSGSSQNTRFKVLCKADDTNKSDLQTYGGLTIGDTITRIGKSTPGLETGYTTKLLSINFYKHNQIRLAVKDSEGNLRPSCSLSSWKKADDKPKFIYPMWFEYKDSGMIVRFDKLDQYTVVVKGTSQRKVGDTNSISGKTPPHTDECWIQVKAPKPPIAIVTKNVNGHPVGSRIIHINGNHWVLESDPKGIIWCHSIGDDCEWEDELKSNNIDLSYTFCKYSEEAYEAYKRLGYQPNFSYNDSNRRNGWVLRADNKIFYGNSMEVFNNLVQDREKYTEVELVNGVFKPVQPLDSITIPKLDTCALTSCDGVTATCDTISINTNCTTVSNIVNNLCQETPHPISPVASSNQSQSNIKENTMNTPNISIAMTADEYAKYQKKNKVAKPKTQLDEAKKTITIWYDQDGAVVSQTTETAKKADKALQHPSKLGYTYRTYTLSDSATTDIPVKKLKV